MGGQVTTSFLVKFHRRSSSTEFPTSSERTGTDFSAAKHQSTSQLTSDRHRPEYSPSERTGPDFSAVKHQSTSQLERMRPLMSSQDKELRSVLFTSTVIPVLVSWTDFSAVKHQSTSHLQPQNRPCRRHWHFLVDSQNTVSCVLSITKECDH